MTTLDIEDAIARLGTRLIALRIISDALIEGDTDAAEPLQLGLDDMRDAIEQLKRGIPPQAVAA